MFRLELWETIIVKGVKTDYEISSEGRVKNKISGKILKTHINKDGYEKVDIRVNGERKSKAVHRLVAKAFVENPNPEEFTEINHIDGNKLNNNMYNLEWTNRSGNIQHAFDHGLILPMSGEKHPGARFSDEEIHEVCRLLESGLKNKEVHKLTGIPKDTISEIRTGKAWTHISSQYKLEKMEGKEHRYSDYTEDQIREACRLMEQGMNNKYVSETLGISYHVIADIRKGKTWRSIAKDFNILPLDNQKRLYTEDQIREACRLMEQGYNNKEVSEMLDISYDVVADTRKGKSWKSISKDFNIQPMHIKTDKSKHWAAIDRMIIQGMSRKDIREAYPIPDITQQQYITLIQNRVDHLKKKGLL